jgi:hypothetical protein
MKLNISVEFNEKEKESLRIVHDIIETIENNMCSKDIVEDIYENNFSGEDIGKFEELLNSLTDEGIKIREEEE